MKLTKKDKRATKQFAKLLAKVATGAEIRDQAERVLNKLSK